MNLAMQTSTMFADDTNIRSSSKSLKALRKV